MNFHNHNSLYAQRHEFPKGTVLADADLEAFYKNIIDISNRVANQQAERGDIQTQTKMLYAKGTYGQAVETLIQGSLERDWYRRNRPYYKVYPGIAPCLFKLKLDCPPAALQLPINKVLLIRFAMGAEPVFNERRVQSILMSHRVDDEGSPMLLSVTSALDNQDVSYTGGYAMFRTGIKDRSTEQCLQDCVMDDDRRKPIFDVMRICFSILLMSRDTDFIKPDVLSADQRVFDETNDELLKQKLLAKAAKRGIVGWTVGESYELIPTLRRPHLGLRWTGQGKTVPKIVPIKGSVVHRHKAVSVPTGIITDQGTEVEQ